MKANTQNTWCRKTLALLLAAVMVLTLLPVTTIPARAEEGLVLTGPDFGEMHTDKAIYEPWEGIQISIDFTPIDDFSLSDYQPSYFTAYYGLVVDDAETGETTYDPADLESCPILSTGDITWEVDLPDGENYGILKTTLPYGLSGDPDTAVIRLYTHNEEGKWEAVSGINTTITIGDDGGGPNPTDAVQPVIDRHPMSATYVLGDTAQTLTISATIDDDGILSYQWYSNTTNSTADGITIDGATNASYTPDISDVGTAYYYCVVTNTNDDATGDKTASTTSLTVTITVNPPAVTIECLTDIPTAFVGESFTLTFRISNLVEGYSANYKNTGVDTGEIDLIGTESKDSIGLITLEANIDYTPTENDSDELGIHNNVIFTVSAKNPGEQPTYFWKTVTVTDPNTDNLSAVLHDGLDRQMISSKPEDAPNTLYGLREDDFVTAYNVGQQSAYEYLNRMLHAKTLMVTAPRNWGQMQSSSVDAEWNGDIHLKSSYIGQEQIISWPNVPTQLKFTFQEDNLDGKVYVFGLSNLLDSAPVDISYKNNSGSEVTKQIMPYTADSVSYIILHEPDGIDGSILMIQNNQGSVRFATITQKHNTLKKIDNTYYGDDVLVVSGYQTVIKTDVPFNFTSVTLSDNPKARFAPANGNAFDVHYVAYGAFDADGNLIDGTTGSLPILNFPPITDGKFEIPFKTLYDNPGSRLGVEFSGYGEGATYLEYYSLEELWSNFQKNASNTYVTARRESNPVQSAVLVDKDGNEQALYPYAGKRVTFQADNTLKVTVGGRHAAVSKATLTIVHVTPSWGGRDNSYTEVAKYTDSADSITQTGWTFGAMNYFDLSFTPAEYWDAVKPGDLALVYLKLEDESREFWYDWICSMQFEEYGQTAANIKAIEDELASIVFFDPNSKIDFGTLKFEEAARRADSTGEKYNWQLAGLLEQVSVSNSTVDLMKLSEMNGKKNPFNFDVSYDGNSYVIRGVVNASRAPIDGKWRIETLDSIHPNVFNNQFNMVKNNLEGPVLRSMKTGNSSWAPDPNTPPAPRFSILFDNDYHEETDQQTLLGHTAGVYGYVEGIATVDANGKVNIDFSKCNAVSQTGVAKYFVTGSSYVTNKTYYAQPDGSMPSPLEDLGYYSDWCVGFENKGASKRQMALSTFEMAPATGGGDSSNQNFDMIENTRVYWKANYAHNGQDFNIGVYELHVGVEGWMSGSYTQSYVYHAGTATSEAKRNYLHASGQLTRYAYNRTKFDIMDFSEVDNRRRILWNGGVLSDVRSEGVEFPLKPAGAGDTAVNTTNSVALQSFSPAYEGLSFMPLSAQNVGTPSTGDIEVFINGAEVAGGEDEFDDSKLLYRRYEASDWGDATTLYNAPENDKIRAYYLSCEDTENALVAVILQSGKLLMVKISTTAGSDSISVIDNSLPSSSCASLVYSGSGYTLASYENDSLRLALYELDADGVVLGTSFSGIPNNIGSSFTLVHNNGTTILAWGNSIEEEDGNIATALYASKLITGAGSGQIIVCTPQVVDAKTDGSPFYDEDMVNTVGDHDFVNYILAYSAQNDLTGLKPGDTANLSVIVRNSGFETITGLQIQLDGGNSVSETVDIVPNGEITLTVPYVLSQTLPDMVPYTVTATFGGGGTATAEGSFNLTLTDIAAQVKDFQRLDNALNIQALISNQSPFSLDGKTIVAGIYKDAFGTMPVAEETFSGDAFKTNIDGSSYSGGALASFALTNTDSLPASLYLIAKAYGAGEVALSDADSTNNLILLHNIVVTSDLSQYTITFDANGGSVSPATMETEADGTLTSLPTATRSNHRFDGWFTEASGGTEVTTSYVFTEITTIYAQWTYTGGVGGGSGSGVMQSNATITTPTGWENPFADVKQGDWFYGDVEYVYANGLMSGTSTSPMLFSPNMTLTRSMIVTILYRAAGSPDVSRLENPFDDVAEGEWYSHMVKWAAANGIVSGYGNGKFGPDDNITRQDLAVILVRYTNFTGMELPQLREYQYLNDNSDITGYAKDAVEKCYCAEIISGKPGNIFDPKGEATRVEAAAMLHRFLEAVNE